MPNCLRDVRRFRRPPVEFRKRSLARLRVVCYDGRMELVEHPTTRAHLRALAAPLFGNLVKAVVDVERKLLLIDAELHADLEACLLDAGSQQEHLWGINLYPDVEGPDWVEFDSVINLKPRFGNLSRSVESPHIQAQIRAVVNAKIR